MILKNGTVHNIASANNITSNRGKFIFKNGTVSSVLTYKKIISPQQSSPQGYPHLVLSVDSSNIASISVASLSSISNISGTE